MILCSVAVASLVGCNMVEKTPEAIAKTVLAKVGDTEITRGDVDKSLSYMLQYYKGQYGDDFEKNEELIDTLKTQRQSALQGLIDQEVLLESKDKLKVSYTDKEIDEEVDKEIASYKESYDNDEKKFKEYLNSYGYSSEDDLKKDLRKNVILSKITDKITEDASVTDEEVQKYYSENIDSYKVKPGGDVTHLLFTDKENGKEEALAAKKLVEQGKTFEEIAAMDEYKDKCTYQDLGYQPYENTSYAAEFVDAYNKLPAGQVSDPVQTSFGWHLIIINNINTEEKTKTFDEVKDEIKETLLTNKKNELYTKKIEKLKKDFKIKTYDNRY